MTYQNTLNVLFNLKKAIPNYSCDTEKNLIAIIGGLDSETSLHIANFLSIYKIPQALPLAVCNDNCYPGYSRKRKEDKPFCCYDCAPCPEGKISDQSGCKDMSNVTIVRYFLLLGFSEQRELQILHLAVFTAMYMAILIGNFLIIILVARTTHLQTPMYFFLVNLSVVDLGSTTVTIPRSIANALMNTTHISYSECAAQMLLFVLFMSSDIFLLAVMAYDRYVAICHPLHYTSVMKWGRCIQLAGGAWAAGFLNAALHTGTIFSLPFCSNIITQFFCEIPHLMKISCANSYLNEMWPLLFSSALGLGCFVLIVTSYVQIFTAVLRMSSKASRQKAFSTCIPHLTVVSLLLSTSLFAYVMPTSSPSFNLDEVLVVIYSVFPPMMNPLIYSMRNKDVKTALRKLFYQKLPNNKSVS
ncbi:olfactory receptor 14I1-like isoform X3 [Podarcis raffonei]|uniref:olfactory receptor 14I1-like isoform X3 n=1 Tax=Podarcis raffonei TaxID=65483 RepID=UPI0023298E46|nr:olfactory receptor 14I1-like isoform X3 [Podarcis raffonei]